LQIVKDWTVGTTDLDSLSYHLVLPKGERMSGSLLFLELLLADSSTSPVRRMITGYAGSRRFR